MIVNVIQSSFNSQQFDTYLKFKDSWAITILTRRHIFRFNSIFIRYPQWFTTTVKPYNLNPLLKRNSHFCKSNKFCLFYIQYEGRKTQIKINLKRCCKSSNIECTIVCYYLCILSFLPVQDIKTLAY